MADSDLLESAQRHADRILATMQSENIELFVFHRAFCEAMDCLPPGSETWSWEVWEAHRVNYCAKLAAMAASGERDWAGKRLRAAAAADDHKHATNDPGRKPADAS